MNEPAFPVYPRLEGNITKEVKGAVGMTLRDYFAAKAMVGVLSGGICQLSHSKNRILLAENSYLMADAMLKERETYEKD